jgi:ATP-binding cassette subfamily F protein uup
LRALEDFLDDWPGALVTVSHDRTFLDRTVEEVLTLEPVAAPVREAVAPARARDGRKAGGPSPSTMRRRIGEAERALKAAEARRDELVAALSSAADHEALAAVGGELAEAEAEVAAAEERWLELSVASEA